MKAYGAEVILVDGIVAARDLAQKCNDAGTHFQMNQFANPATANALRDHRSRGVARHKRKSHAFRELDGYDRDHHGYIKVFEIKEQRDSNRAFSSQPMDRRFLESDAGHRNTCQNLRT